MPETAEKRMIGAAYWAERMDRGCDAEDLDCEYETNVLLALRSIDDKLAKLIEKE